MPIHNYPGGFSSFNYPGLDVLIELHVDGLIRELDKLDEPDLAESPFIDHNLEATIPEVGKHIATVTNVFDDDGRDTVMLGRAVRVPYHFAHMISSVVFGRPSSMVVPPIFTPGMGYLDARSHLSESVSEYLGDRPSLDGLIGAYITELDESDRYAHVAELVAGSTFMGIDIAEQRIAAAEVDAAFWEAIGQSPS